MMMTRTAIPTAMRMRIFMSFLQITEWRASATRFSTSASTRRSSHSPPLPTELSVSFRAPVGHSLSRTHHLLPHAVGTPPEALRRDGQVVCTFATFGPASVSPFESRPTSRARAHAPVLSWRASRCSPRSATLLMLSRMMPTVSSIWAWMAAVLELPEPGAAGAPVGFVDALPPRYGS